MDDFAPWDAANHRLNERLADPTMTPRRRKALLAGAARGVEMAIDLYDQMLDGPDAPRP